MMEAGWSAQLVARQVGRSYLTWCRALRDWTETEWNHVVFSEESRFNLSSDDNRVRVRKLRDERLNPAIALQRRIVPKAGVKEPFFNKTILGHAQQGYHKTASTTLPPFPACLIARFVTNQAYLGSYGMASWTAYDCFELQARSQQQWNEMSQNIIRNLYASTLASIASCIRASGDPTKY
ncbi:transposable element Tcb1 transposase [Trichonephila clavipes]|nr:transposable element Tcb1 transposase [Trichonephila clavipes]